MAHPLVDQLRFTRSEWLRSLEGVPEEDGLRRLQPMNSIGWIVAHLAWHEQINWLTRLRGETPLPILNEVARNGGPATTPPLGEMLAAWQTVTSASEGVLDALAPGDLERTFPNSSRVIGSTIHRITYHYWFHIGEILAIRQVLGHPGLPEFVGDIDRKAPYRPERRAG